MRAACTDRTVFDKQPTSLPIYTFMGPVTSNCRTTPKYILCDQGEPFACPTSEPRYEDPGISPAGTRIPNSDWGKLPHRGIPGRAARRTASTLRLPPGDEFGPLLRSL